MQYQQALDIVRERKAGQFIGFVHESSTTLNATQAKTVCEIFGIEYTTAKDISKRLTRINRGVASIAGLNTYLRDVQKTDADYEQKRPSHYESDPTDSVLLQLKSNPDKKYIGFHAPKVFQTNWRFDGLELNDSQIELILSQAKKATTTGTDGQKIETNYKVYSLDGMRVLGVTDSDISARDFASVDIEEQSNIEQVA